MTSGFQQTLRLLLGINRLKWPQISHRGVIFGEFLRFHFGTSQESTCAIPAIPLGCRSKIPSGRNFAFQIFSLNSEMIRNIPRLGLADQLTIFHCTYHLKRHHLAVTLNHGNSRTSPCAAPIYFMVIFSWHALSCVFWWPPGVPPKNRHLMCHFLSLSMKTPISRYPLIEQSIP